MSEVPDIPERDGPRATPWELIFGPTVFDHAQFAAIQAQAEYAGAQDASELFMLPAAGELLRAMTPPEGGREAIGQVRALIHAAYRFWLFGRNVYRISERELRTVLDAAAPAPALPQPAGYVQLPRHVLWARVSDDVAPEPVDGFFWSARDDVSAGPLALLFTLGVRTGRPGLSLFDLRLESAAQLAPWGTTQVRSDGDDFANILPGGELQGYLAITTSAEALKLAALCLGHIATRQSTESAAADQRLHEPTDG